MESGIGFSFHEPPALVNVLPKNASYRPLVNLIQIHLDSYTACFPDNLRSPAKTNQGFPNPLAVSLMCIRNISVPKKDSRGTLLYSISVSEKHPMTVI